MAEVCIFFGTLRECRDNPCRCLERVTKKDCRNCNQTVRGGKYVGHTLDAFCEQAPES